MTAMNFKLLNYLKFKSVENWRFNDSEKFNNYFKINTVLFGKIIGKSPIVREKIIDENQYSIIGVRSYGKGAYINRVVKGEKLTMKLYQVVPKNHLIWCKVDTKNGAFGIVPDSFEGSYASSNMSLAKINLNRVNLEYLQILFRIPKFNEYMDNSVTGSTNRKYLTFDQILNDVQVPLPDLTSQNQLVNQYNKNLAKAQEAENQANELEKDIEIYLLNELGIELSKPIERKQGLQFLRAKDLSRWDCDFLENQWIFKLIIENGKYDTINFGDVLLSSQYGISEMSDKEVKGLPMLRMNNIFNGELDVSNLKYVEMKGDTSKLLLQKGDLLFNRTNSKELVGKTAIFDIDGDFLFASYLIRLKLDISKIDINYVNYLFNSKIIRTQINMVSRQIIGQANINLTELKSFVFPIPPPEIQTQIVNHITTQKEQIKNLRQQAEKLRKQAKENFEKEIFVTT